MTITSIGDLAQSLVLRSRAGEIKQAISQLTEELSTGRTADVAQRLGGDYSYLSDIEHNLKVLDGYALAASEAATFAGETQSSLERLHESTSSLSGALLLAGTEATDAARKHASAQAGSALETVVSTLNRSVAGRSLFSGTQTDHAPLATAQDLLGALKATVTGLSTSSEIMTAVETWFSDPAGFASTMYFGGDIDLASIQIGPGEQVSVSLRADNAAFQNLMKNVAVAALAADPDLALSRSVQSELISGTGENLLGVGDVLIRMSADLGFAQARIEEAAIRSASARTGLQYARQDLLEADPFDTATRLESLQFHLESLYSATVRTSRLSLVNFLK